MGRWPKRGMMAWPGFLAFLAVVEQLPQFVHLHALGGETGVISVGLPSRGWPLRPRMAFSCPAANHFVSVGHLAVGSDECSSVSEDGTDRWLLPST